MTSKFDGLCEGIDSCCVAPLDHYEIDEQPANPPTNSDSHLYQLCENISTVVAFSCSCQQLCVSCIMKYALTDTGRKQRDLNTSGDPVINEANPLKCPHCTKIVTLYIITRRWNQVNFFIWCNWIVYETKLLFLFSDLSSVIKSFNFDQKYEYFWLFEHIFTKCINSVHLSQSTFLSLLTKNVPAIDFNVQSV